MTHEWKMAIRVLCPVTMGYRRFIKSPKSRSLEVLFRSRCRLAVVLLHFPINRLFRDCLVEEGRWVVSVSVCGARRLKNENIS